MIYRSKFLNSVRRVAPSCAVVAAGLALALCLPHQVSAQGAYNSERRNSNTIVCSSNDGRRAYCDIDARGGVRLVRQLSGSSCQQGSTWGYDSRGVWVDRGCRAEFDVSGGSVSSNSGRIVCSSDDGRRAYCDADTRGGVRLVRQVSGSPCQQGSTWGYDSRGVWVDQGCRAEFDLSGGGSYVQTRMIGAGSSISVRTNEAIDVRRSDGRVFSGTVNQDVIDADGGLAIPRGSSVELIVKSISNQDLVIDLASVTVNGQRYAVTTYADGIAGGRRDGFGTNARTGEFLGGGALLGTVIGAIAGGGKGAAIGAGAGAGAGAGTQFLTRGRSVRVPAESLLTFRLEQPLDMGVLDNGINRNGRHYHTSYR
jgi:hypothetical protein